VQGVLLLVCCARHWRARLAITNSTSLEGPTPAETICGT
jgi:hypothetical protein